MCKHEKDNISLLSLLKRHTFASMQAVGLGAVLAWGIEQVFS
jgi:hypothetical protein